MRRIGTLFLVTSLAVIATQGCGSHMRQARHADLGAAIQPTTTAPPTGVLAGGQPVRKAGGKPAPAPATTAPAGSPPPAASAKSTRRTGQSTAADTSGFRKKYVYANHSVPAAPAFAAAVKPVPLAPAADTIAMPKPGAYVHVDRLPVAIERVPYVYPPAARAAGVEGFVVVAALVGVDGSVRDVRMARSIPMLDEAAMAAVRQWKFSPAFNAGKPVAVWYEVPLQFLLAFSRPASEPDSSSAPR